MTIIYRVTLDDDSTWLTENYEQISSDFGFSEVLKIEKLFMLEDEDITEEWKSDYLSRL